MGSGVLGKQDGWQLKVIEGEGEGGGGEVRMRPICLWEEAMRSDDHGED